MNLGRALLQGAASGLKSAADQVAADHELDNRIRLMAVDDMFKQRIAEQGRNWNIEDRNQDRTWKNEDQQHAEDLATDTEYAGKLGQAEAAKQKPVFDAGVANKKQLGNDIDYLSAESNIHNATNPNEARTLDLKERQLQAEEGYKNGLLGLKQQRLDGGSSRGGSDSTDKLRDDTLKFIDAKNKELSQYPEGSKQYAETQDEIKQANSFFKGLLYQGAYSSSDKPQKDYGDPAQENYIKKLVTTKAQEYGIDPVLAHAVIKTESNYNPKADNPNSTATGLGQIIPRYHNTSEAEMRDPVKNLDKSFGFLSQLQEKYGDPSKAVAAYYLGESDFAKYDNDVNKIPSDAKSYVNSIMSTSQKIRDSGSISQYSLGSKESAESKENELSPYLETKSQPKEIKPTVSGLTDIGWSKSTSNEIIDLLKDDRISSDELSTAQVLLRRSGGKNEHQALINAIGSKPFTVGEGEDAKIVPGKYVLKNGDIVTDPVIEQLQAFNDSKAKQSPKDNVKLNQVEQQPARQPVDLSSSNINTLIDQEIEKERALQVKNRGLISVPETARMRELKSYKDQLNKFGERDDTDSSKYDQFKQKILNSLNG